MLRLVHAARARDSHIRGVDEVHAKVKETWKDTLDTCTQNRYRARHARVRAAPFIA